MFHVLVGAHCGLHSGFWEPLSRLNSLTSLASFFCWTLPTSTNHLPPIQTFLLRSDHLSHPHAAMHHLKCVPILQPILISSVVNSEPPGSDEHCFPSHFSSWSVCPPFAVALNFAPRLPRLALGCVSSMQSPWKGLSSTYHRSRLPWFGK